MGKFFFELMNADGSLAKEWSCKNSVTIPGVADMLNTTLIAGPYTQKPWQVGLIAGPINVTALQLTDTIIAKNWLEAIGYYGLRPAWIPGPPVAGMIPNPGSPLNPPPLVPAVTLLNQNPASFLMSDNGQLGGAFILSGSPADPGSPAGVLFSTAIFEAPVSFVAGQILDVTYEVMVFLQ
jgi:hypothetical protein